MGNARGLSERGVEVGILFYLATIPFGPTLPPFWRQLALGIVLLGIVAQRLGKSSAASTHYAMLLPFSLFAGSHLLSILFSEQPEASAARSTYAPIACLFFFAAQHSAQRVERLRRMSIAMAWVCGVLALDGFAQYLMGESLLAGRPMARGRVSASIPHPNDLALIPLCVPFVFALLSDGGRGRTRAMAVFLLPLVCFTVIVSQSRNAWLGLGVASIAYPLLAGKRRWLLVLGLVAALCIASALAFDWGDFRSRLASLMVWRTEGRIGVWLVAWELFSEAPWLGKGAHLFGEYYLPYLEQIQLPAGYTPEFNHIPWVHNLILEFLSERGIVGLSSFVFVVVVAIKRLRTQRDEGRQGEVAPYATALLCAWVVFLSMGIFDLTFLKDWVSLYFWLLVGLSAAIAGAIPRPASAPETQSRPATASHTEPTADP